MADAEEAPPPRGHGASPQTVAVTGLNGFIGRRLAPGLAAAGFAVRALLRRPAPNLTPSMIPPLEAPPVDFPPMDAPPIEARILSLSDRAGVEAALAGVDAVIHLAGTVRGRRAVDFWPANVEAVVNLAEAAARQPRPPAFLLVSSLAASQPQLSAYAASKSAGEQALQAYPHLDWTIIRPSAVYGPGDVELMPMLRLMRRGLTLVPGNPRQRLAFLHVDDLAAAILCWLQDPARCRQGQFSIDDGAPDGYDWPAISAAAGGSGRRTLVIPPSALRLAARLNLLLSRLLGRAPMLTPGKVRELLHDRWSAEDGSYGLVTGWRPRYDLASGLRHTFGGEAKCTQWS